MTTIDPPLSDLEKKIFWLFFKNSLVKFKFKFMCLSIKVEGFLLIMGKLKIFVTSSRPFDATE